MFDKLQNMLRGTQQVESLGVAQVITTLIIASVCGLIIFLVYRYFNKGVVYSASFNLLVVMICVVTAFIIITIGANLVLSLGMVGALSIVRFRAAVKDPLDVGFLFWGVAAGLTAGAGLYSVAMLGTAFIALLYISFTYLHLDKRTFLLIVRYDKHVEAEVSSKLAPLKAKIKNKTLAADYTELTAEVRLQRNDTSFMEPMRSISGVSSVVLVEYSGNYT